MTPYLQVAQLEESDRLDSAPIKLADVKKMKIKVDDLEVLEELLRKKKKINMSERKGKEKIG